MLSPLFAGGDAKHFTTVRPSSYASKKSFVLFFSTPLLFLLFLPLPPFPSPPPSALTVAGKQTRIFSRWPRASHFSAISSAKIGFSQTCEGDCRGHPPENLTPGLQENTGAEKVLPKSFVWTNRLDFDRLQLIWRFSLKPWETQITFLGCDLVEHRDYRQVQGRRWERELKVDSR